LSVFFGKLKEKRKFSFDKKVFCKEGFILKIVSNMERRDKDKPSKGLECYVKV
jgi:hypothetical protein